MVNINKKLKEVWGKLKTIKHIEVILAIAAICVIIVLYVTVTAFTDKSANAGTGAQTTSTGTQKPASADGATELETRLEAVLSKIEGAGRVSVMLTFKEVNGTIDALSGFAGLSTGGGAQEITGVVIVAEGGADMKTKLRLIQAAQTVLNVKSSAVLVLPMS